MRALAALACVLLAACATAGLRPERAPHDAVVDARHAGAEGGTVRGVPTFRTVGAALRAAPAAGGGRYVVFVRDGRYREKLSVERPDVTLLGESRDGTVLTYDAASGHAKPGGGTWGTRGSHTLRIAAPGFRAENLTIENAFDYPANAARADDDPARVRNAQAVALLLDRGSDRATFVDCRIAGYQDTLFADAGRSYFRGCEILGHVDFVFGGGRAVFEECDIVSRAFAPPGDTGYVAAPSTPVGQPYGFLFVRSRLERESAGVAPGSVALGRPWHPTSNPHVDPAAAFVDTWMDDHVRPAGWTGMNGADGRGGRRWWGPETARFFEYRSRGPGAGAAPGRRVLTDEEARSFTVARVLDGWVP